jgi:16S rRNA (guanine(966)-N(2))-methyltransferase RsmD
VGVRIIAGQLRGRTYKAKKDVAVRPISGRIKQSLFDIMAGLVPGSKWLDLFAGTGAVGIEALSRGAEFAFFVDQSRRCVEDLEAVLKKIGFADKARVQPGNVTSDLSWIPFRGGPAQFDVIFMGPPYKDEEKRPLALSTPALARVAEANLLAPKGWLICQHQVKEDVAAPAGLVQVRREKYGDTYLDFFRHAA